MGRHRFIQLDVFNRTPFAGNSQAVFPEAEGITDDEMQKIAREMNLSETVFVLKPEARPEARIKDDSPKPPPEPVKS